MPLELPEPDYARLARSPLELVVCQLRFDTQLKASEASTARAIHEALNAEAELYPSIDQVQTETVELFGVIGAGVGPTTSKTQVQGWQFKSLDKNWTVQVFRDSVSLETTAFDTWADDFQPRLFRLLDVVVEHLDPAVEQRLGLRFVDRIDELGLDTIAGWEPYLDRGLLGIIVDEQLGPWVRGSRQELIIELDGEEACGLRHGPVIAQDRGTVDYLLDFDVFRQVGKPFDVEATKQAAARFNRWAHQLFQALVTDKLLNELGKEGAV